MTTPFSSTGSVQFLVSSLVLMTAMTVYSAPDPAGLEKLQGKWSIQKTNQEGRVTTQTLEVAKDQVNFQILSTSGEVRFVARGKMETEQLGPFKAMKISNIEAGSSATELRPTLDDRSSIYVLDQNTWLLASNFDKEREGQLPGLERYVRVPASKQGSESDLKVMGNWKMEVVMGDSTRDYELRIARVDGQLAIVLVSPRSGEFKCKNVVWKDEALQFEVDREIQGSNVTFQDSGKTTPSGLTGTVTLKDNDSFGKGDWTAKK